MKARLVLAACLVLLACVALAARAAPGQEAEPGQVRLAARLPGLFNFQKFKQLFNKHYSSLLEEMARQKIVLGRAFRAFVSMVKYKHRQLSYFLSVNTRSDWTPEERAKSRVDPERVRVPEGAELKVVELDEPVASPRPPPEAEPAQSEPMGEAEATPVAEPEDIERQLAEIESKREQPGYKELAAELELMREERLARRRRDLEQRQAKLSPDNLMHPNEAELSAGARRKLQHRVPSNNPDYEPPELSSSAAGDEGEWNWMQPLGESVINRLRQLPGAQYLRNVVESSLGAPTPGEVVVAKEAEQELDKVYVDMRDEDCFYQVRDQGNCGSCYSFAVVALHEFLFCKETNKLVAFSEQYMVDCGDRKGMLGCEGGRLDHATSYVEAYGLELRSDYPYRVRKDTCPYDKGVSRHHMGRVRTLDPGSGMVMMDKFDLYMSQYERPIVFCLRVSSDFEDYGGGVDMGKQCEKGGAHAMLIIGHGREDGQEYYLFRNSHSISWGEQGYLKFAKSQMNRCACNDFGFVSTGHYKKPSAEDLLNPKYKSEPVSNRFKEYIRQEVVQSG